MRTMVLALIMLVSTTAFVSDRPNPGPIAYDDEYILLHQVSYVDIPVLDDDVNPGPGQPAGGGCDRGRWRQGGHHRQHYRAGLY